MHKALSPKDVIQLVKEKSVKFIDFRFMDYPGLQQHFTVPAAELSEDTFEEGLGFDGSSIRGWRPRVNEQPVARGRPVALANSA